MKFEGSTLPDGNTLATCGNSQTPWVSVFFEEKISGKDSASLALLGRPRIDFIIDKLQEKNAPFISLKENDDQGSLMLSIFAGLSQF